MCATAPALAGLAASVVYTSPSDEELGIPADAVAWVHRPLPRDLPGRRVPVLTVASNLGALDLRARAVPLPCANTLAHLHFQERRLGFVDGVFFNPETVLVKFRGEAFVSALRVEPLKEWEAVQTVRRRADVQFAELDTIERRQFTPDDPLLDLQWHHSVIGSFQAWQTSLGSPAVRVAIVDTPFQMNHPDLAANTVSGWDVVANQPVTASGGIAHSTLCAGMAAAVVNNGTGGAGAANGQILPVNINGAISEMYDATLWAATNGARVVNISWSGGTNAVLEAAGYFLKTNAGGILFMSAVDGYGTLNGSNQPDVYCVSMTDAADNVQGTLSGPYIDFAAPGYNIYSTTTNGGYAYATGCSFAAPLVAGMAAWMFGLNPTLAPEEVIDILTNTAVPLGAANYYGAGRVDFAAAATATIATLPNILDVHAAGGVVSLTANYRPGLAYALWQTGDLSEPGTLATNVAAATNGNTIILRDLSPPAGGCFYRVVAGPP